MSSMRLEMQRFHPDFAPPGPQVGPVPLEETSSRRRDRETVVIGRDADDELESVADAVIFIMLTKFQRLAQLELR